MEHSSEVQPPEILQNKAETHCSPNNMDVLSKAAFDMAKIAQRDRIIIDRTRNEIIRTRFGTHQKTIYRFLTPESLGLKLSKGQPRRLSQKNSNPAGQLTNQKPTKLGRPRKRPAANALLTDLAKKPAPTNTATTEPKSTNIAPELRTRSGRVVKQIQPAQSSAANRKTPDTNGVKERTPPAPDTVRQLLTDLKDRNYTCNNIHQRPITPPNCFDENDEEPIKPLATSSPTKRRVPPEALCPTCHKIFLGRRLQRHFASHPDHMIVSMAAAIQVPPPHPSTANANTNSSHDSSSTSEELTLFRFLASKLLKSHLNEDQRAELFLNEINDLVEQLQLRSSRLIRSTSGLHMVNAPTARVLGIPEGQYALDMSAFETPLEPESLINFSNALPAPSGNTRSLDYGTLSVSIDDTLTDEAVQKLNLSAGGKLLPPSEESLLRAVDDFVVRDGMEKLSETGFLRPPVVTTEAAVVPHYDHASDNAVEAVSMKETPTTQQAPPMLDLAVDFFQFNNN